MALDSVSKSASLFFARQRGNRHVAVFIELPKCAVGTQCPDCSNGAHQSDGAMRSGLVIDRERWSAYAGYAAFDLFLDAGGESDQGPNAVLSRCRLTAVGMIVARPRQSAWTHS